MDLYLSLSLALHFVCACYVLTTIILGRRSSVKPSLPPGPRRFPIIGNILSFTNKPHIALAYLSKTYGPIMTLKFGSITTIVISSPEAAKEALHKNAEAVSSRTVGDCMRALDHNKFSLIWMPVSDHWRHLRKITATEIFLPQRLDATQEVRRKRVQDLLNYVQQCCSSGEPIDISRATFIASLNLISNTFFSIDLAHYDSNSSFKEFYQLILGIVDVVGKPNIADNFPFLKKFDPQGVYRRLTGYFDKLFVIYEDIIKERLQVRTSSAGDYEGNDDVLDSLLNHIEKEGSEFNMRHLKHLLLDLFVAGINTTSGTMEWAMTELIRSPKTMAKLRDELREVIGKDGLLEESDIPKLPYLQAIVKETLRLHSPIPFLIPHKAKSDIEICGYHVPEQAQVLVNLWAMARDPDVWSNPNSFEPERFLESEIDMKGRNFELIPFGAGRRMCPGMPLAHRMVHLMVASLIHSFDWKLADGLTPETMDTTERFGLTLRKETPLRASPIKI